MFIQHVSSRQSGFTLVELSIVLVIIGLIVSSVLVGQDLIRNAELRSTIGQYEQFNAAIGTFRGKYGGLPGDVLGEDDFGFVGNGNGDGIFTDDVTPATDLDYTLTTVRDDHQGELVYFWSHLGSSGASLISGDFDGQPVDDSVADLYVHVPEAKMGGGWGIFSSQGINYYVLGVVAANVDNNYTTTGVLSPNEAFSIDDKIDDGRPARGIVQARGASSTDPDTEPSYDADDGINPACTKGTDVDYDAAVLAGAVTYNTEQDITENCTLRIRVAF